MQNRLLIAGAMVVCLTSPSFAQVKVGVVDVRKVMEAVPAWKNVVAKMKKEWETKQSNLQADQAKLRAEKDKLDAKRVVSDPKTIAKEEAALYKKAQSLAENYRMQQRIITQQELSLKDQMLKRIEPLVQSIAGASDYSFVFETGSDQQPNVLYNSKKTDLTAKIISAYKKQYKNKKFEIPQPRMSPGGLGLSK